MLYFGKQDDELTQCLLIEFDYRWTKKQLCEFVVINFVFIVGKTIFMGNIHFTLVSITLRYNKSRRKCLI